MTHTNKWDQQPNETDLHYNYFQIYKDIHPTTRTIKKVKETLHHKGKDLTHEYLRMVSADNKWQDRVKAYDAYNRSLMTKAKESHITDMNNRHSDIGARCIDIIGDQLCDPELLQADVNKRPYLLQALIRGLEGAVRIERLALGESTSNTRQVNEGINNLMMVLTDSKKELIKHNKKDHKANDKDIIDIDYTNVSNESD